MSVTGGTISPPPPPSGASLLDTVDWGTQVSDQSINVYFARSGESSDGVTSEGWTAYEISQFEAAFDLISAVADVTFNVVSNRSTSDFVLIADTNEFDSLGYFNPPGTTNAGTGVFGVDDWDRGPNGDLQQGGFGFVTIVHELLHGMGMAHPHDRGGSSSVMAGVTSAFDDTGSYGLNQGVFTTMSYNSGVTDVAGVTSSGLSGDHGFEAGPMAIDIAVLQASYGANTSHNTGNDTYILDDTNGQGTMWTSLWDAGGNDTIRYNGSRNTTIDLREATLEQAVGDNGDDIAIGGFGRDVAFLGNGNDTFEDNGQGGFFGADRIFGGNGNDSLSAGGGNDSVFGGTGNDTMGGGNGNDLILAPAAMTASGPTTATTTSKAALAVMWSIWAQATIRSTMSVRAAFWGPTASLAAAASTTSPCAAATIQSQAVQVRMCSSLWAATSATTSSPTSPLPRLARMIRSSSTVACSAQMPA